jgi:hypothetical protein
LETKKELITIKEVKCVNKKVKRKGKEYTYPSYSIPLKKTDNFHCKDKVVVGLEDDLKKLFSIDDLSTLGEEIGNLSNSKGRILELEDLKSTHSTQLGNLTHDKEVVEIELKHTKERLLKEQKDTQELEAILKEYMEANILTVWFNRRFKRLPELPLKPTAEDNNNGNKFD